MNILFEYLMRNNMFYLCTFVASISPCTMYMSMHTASCPAVLSDATIDTKFYT